MLLWKPSCFPDGACQEEGSPGEQQAVATSLLPLKPYRCATMPPAECSLWETQDSSPFPTLQLKAWWPGGLGSYLTASTSTTDGLLSPAAHIFKVTLSLQGNTLQKETLTMAYDNLILQLDKLR